jgi:HAD superfamily hydrolase (TIGR01662 family)
MLYFNGKARSVPVPVEAVIFDLDGTLLDTKEIFYDIIKTVFNTLDLPLVGREILVEAAAQGEFNWDLILPAGLKARKEEMLLQVRAIIEEIAPPLFRQRTRPIAGARGVLKSLHGAGSRIGVVTSSRMRHVEMKMHAFEESSAAVQFDAIVTADDIQTKKPSPEPLYECARRLGVAPGKCVYVGDMRVDIKAGKSAGMTTVGVLTGFDGYDHLKNELPDLILESVASLKNHLSPCVSQNGF